jgi:hypothetical protein
MSNQVRLRAPTFSDRLLPRAKEPAHSTTTIPFAPDPALGADLAVTDIHSYQFVAPLSRRTTSGFHHGSKRLYANVHRPGRPCRNSVITYWCWSKPKLARSGLARVDTNSRHQGFGNTERYPHRFGGCCITL